MKSTFFKVSCRLATLALAAGAIPALVAPASAYETGQMLDKGPRWPHKGYRTIGSAECPGPKCTSEVIDQAVQRGQITPKEAKALRKIQNIPQANRSGGPGGGPRLAIVGGLAALGAIIAVSGGGGPSSP